MAETKSNLSEERQKTQRPMLKRVLCNYLPVSDIGRATNWYEETFGLTVRRSGSEDGAILVLGNGQWLFLLESTDQRNANFTTDQWDGEGYEMFSLTFEVGDIIGLHKKLQKSEAEVGPLVDHGSCGLQFKFKDIDGNKFNVWKDPISD